MNRHIHIFAALILTALVSCQQKGETAIEFDLTDIPEALQISVARIQGNVGRVLFTDSTCSTVRKFTVRCDSTSEGTYYDVAIHKACNGQPISFMMRAIHVQEGTTTRVSGSDVYPSEWKIESKNPKQAFYNTLNDSARDILKQLHKLDFAMNEETDKNKLGAMIATSTWLSKQLQAKELEIMKTMPIDRYWIEELRNKSYIIGNYEEGHPLRARAKEFYNMLSDSVKQTGNGKAIYNSLYTIAPEIGDKFIDHDLYDADGNIHHLDDFKGKWLLLDFSSYYCSACRMFTPTASYLYGRGITDNFELITIVGDTQSPFEAMAAKEKYFSPLFNDRDEKDGIFTIYKVSAYPTFFVIDPDGIIRDRFMGADVATIANLIQSHGGFAAPTTKRENGVTVIMNPTFSSVSGDLLIDRIEIHKDSVVLDCTDPIYGSFKITKEASLFANGKCISKITHSSVGFDTNTQVPLGKTGHCRLTFEPLPKGVKQFDFITGDCETCFRVLGVNIEN